MMKILVASAGLLAFLSFCAGAEWDAFQVTFGKGEGNGYFDMPWTVQEATAQGKWTKLDEDKPLNVDVYSQPEDPRVMLLFDKKNNIAGIRLAFLKKDVQKKALEGGHSFDFDYDNNPSYEKGNYFGEDLWYATVLFQNPTNLKSGGRSPLNKDTDNVAEGIYFRSVGPSGVAQWEELNKDECKNNDNFAEGNCFAGMGKHYFYKLDIEDCKNRNPFWSLFDDGRLIGYGFGGYGSFTKHPKTQNYYEDIQSNAARVITRNAPKCMEDYINKYGMTSMHVFFKKNASKLTCPTEDWRSTHCQ